MLSVASASSSVCLFVGALEGNGLSYQHQRRNIQSKVHGRLLACIDSEVEMLKDVRKAWVFMSIRLHIFLLCIVYCMHNSFKTRQLCARSLWDNRRVSMAGGWSVGPWDGHGGTITHANQLPLPRL